MRSSARTNHSTTITIIFISLISLWVFYSGAAHAFCIYNKSDRSWYVDQVQGDSVRNPFAPKISPGDDECCDWDDSDCNTSKSRHARVVFDVKSSLSSGGAMVACSGVTIPADGEFSIRGSGGQYYCQIH